VQEWFNLVSNIGFFSERLAYHVSEPRQADFMGGLTNFLSSSGRGLLDFAIAKKRAVKIEELTPKNPEAKRIRITWGPLRLKGANVSVHAY
jgi:hypothetical protein